MATKPLGFPVRISRFLAGAAALFRLASPVLDTTQGRQSGPRPDARQHGRCGRDCRFPWLLLVLVAVVPQGRLWAQHAEHPAQLPILVDGDRTPEAIPDDLAWAHFLAAIALEENALERDRKRQEAQLRPLGLEPDHQAALKRILAGLKTALKENERALEKAAQGAQTLETSRRIASLLAQRKQLSSAAVGDLRRTLPEEAFARIENHVRTHVKRRIVIYGTRP
ncbi:MAG: hypothetical protein ACPL7M_12880 [Bryobacteraceae bacterium]